MSLHLGRARAPHQLQLLYDGTAASGQMDGDPAAAIRAKAAAALLVDAAMVKRP